MSATYHFNGFVLDPEARTLCRDGVPVELGGRYFDALVLLVDNAGGLVTKHCFLEQVWRGVPVTDEALTQCIRVLRRQLGDDAARPSLIETVPKHGYRFCAVVSRESAPPPVAARWRPLVLLGAAGTLGAAVAGALGGLVYGFAAAPAAGQGGASAVIVLFWVTLVVAATGGAGVSFGIAAALARPWPATAILGGGLGGAMVGGLVKLLGIDAFNLLLGRAPSAITGAPEGAVLGASVGLGLWLVERAGLHASRVRAAALAALIGAIGGAATVLLGGRLMGGSLDLLGQTFPGARLRLDLLGPLFGETGFGPITQLIAGTLEGALFAACIVSAMGIARRDWRRVPHGFTAKAPLPMRPT